MIIDYNGEKGFNFFSRRYDYILGHHCKRTFIESFKFWMIYDVYYNFILGLTYTKDENNNITVKNYNPFYKKMYYYIPNRIRFYKARREVRKMNLSEFSKWFRNNCFKK